MSGVNYSPIEPGDSRAAATLNTIWDAIEAASAVGAVAATNFAEEGIDSRALEDHPVGYRTGIIRETGRNAASLAVSAAYAQFVQNGTTFQLTSAANQLPASLAAGELLRVRARVTFETTLVAGVGYTGDLLLRLARGGNEIDYSGVGADPGTGVFQHTSEFLEGWVVGPIVTLTSVELEYSLGVGQTAIPTRGMMWATLFRRQQAM